MKNIINKISQALQVILLAPIKLPGKALNIIKYVAVGLGILESVLDNGKPESESQKDKESGNADIDVSEETEERPEPDRKEEADET
ncbi:hypothetical protein FAZ15_04435 [Sphingobacterium olei]|uniref:Uncharacterized protein n=1 Tax=Sphingobacterium olei TaxID=2571155 RepID=A0A4U0P3N8_9SPHI|nr:hypothetical protein [Sphingobacterium olei]TJZ61770.1 hypothetical protein FAZ15_04435 [Sphingobacterium olei]